MEIEMEIKQEIKEEIDDEQPEKGNNFLECSVVKEEYCVVKEEPPEEDIPDELPPEELPSQDCESMSRQHHAAPQEVVQFVIEEIQEKPYQCPTCQASFFTDTILKGHMVEHHSTDSTYNCPECAKTFTNKESLLSHVASHLRDQMLPDLPCKYCGKIFKSPGRLESHVKSHENQLRRAKREHVCPICRAGFVNDTELEAHKEAAHSAEEAGQNAKNPMNATNIAKERHQRGKALPFEKKEMVVNIYNETKEKNPEFGVTDLIQITAETSGIGKRSIWKIINDYRRNKTIVAPETTKKRHCFSLKVRMNNFTKSAIRRRVNGLYLKRTAPGLQKAFEVVNNDKNLPDVKRSTFYNLLLGMNFTFVKCKGKNTLREKEEIIKWRSHYLRSIRKHREEGRMIYFLDETPLEVNISKKMKRFLIMHVASVEGFVEGALHWFETDKKLGEEEMTGDAFLEYFRKILPLLRENSVIVMDDASYHSVKSENNVVDWIDDVAEKSGQTILRLPPYHGDLNPIEYAWPACIAYMQEKLPASPANVADLLQEATTSLITQQDWKDYALKAEEEEARCTQVDEIANSMLNDVEMTSEDEYDPSSSGNSSKS
uniref:C2H2-type domain-containing protein n=1 Tax=Lutzomyia longipalpis TaxID=7200 RepID=A0A1B0F009_LUTLO